MHLSTFPLAGFPAQVGNGLLTPLPPATAKIVPLDEVFRPPFSQVELAKGANVVVHEDAGIDAHAEISEIPKDDGEVKIRPDALVWEVPGHDPEWKWDEKSEEICDGYPLVTSADGEHLGGDGPGDCEGVEGLNVCSRPNGCPLNRQEIWSLIFHDARDG
ncbi:hypothetical protein DSL72_001748 [Monilinia vaccinii-corymbosi]|uniref:Uncharacterized protein n=1 Tax=Monilinia vaccinii-corymbosi TaxID=61207 RepID=A0A8A3PAQ1_9HELO|nr:hypothetical protein DSL72_001748 [Monilinia vaccinii-corymbosi]